MKKYFVGLFGAQRTIQDKLSGGFLLGWALRQAAFFGPLSSISDNTARHPLNDPREDL